MEPAWLDGELLTPVGPRTRARVLAGDGRWELDRSWPSVSPSSGANPDTYTKPTTLSLSPAAVMTAPTVRVPYEHHGTVDGGKHGLRVSRIAGCYAAERVRRCSDVKTLAGECGVQSAPARGICERAMDEDDRWIGHTACFLGFVVTVATATAASG
jgi:hypothetical protein